jgi:uncharacterized membrane protein YqjE
MSESSGLMESLKRLMGNLLAIVQTRLDLLSNEAEEERLRIGQRFFYGSIALLFFGLAITLLTVLILVMVWDSYRLPALGVFAALYFIAGILAWSALRRVASEKSKMFSASLDELAEDRDRLSSSS